MDRITKKIFLMNVDFLRKMGINRSDESMDRIERLTGKFVTRNTWRTYVKLSETMLVDKKVDEAIDELGNPQIGTVRIILNAYNALAKEHHYPSIDSEEHFLETPLQYLVQPSCYPYVSGGGTYYGVYRSLNNHQKRLCFLRIFCDAEEGGKLKCIMITGFNLGGVDPIKQQLEKISSVEDFRNFQREYYDRIAEIDRLYMYAGDVSTNSPNIYLHMEGVSRPNSIRVRDLWIENSKFKNFIEDNSHLFPKYKCGIAVGISSSLDDINNSAPRLYKILFSRSELFKNINFQEDEEAIDNLLKIVLSADEATTIRIPLEDQSRWESLVTKK